MCMSAERDEGFNWHTLQRFIAGYQPPTKPVPARNGTYAPSPRRLATKSSGSGRKIASGAKQERAERKKVLALALSDSKLNATESPKLFASEKKSRDIIVLLLEQATHQQQTVSRIRPWQNHSLAEAALCCCRLHGVRGDHRAGSWGFGNNGTENRFNKLSNLKLFI